MAEPIAPAAPELAGIAGDTSIPLEPDWPTAANGRISFLIEATGRLEERMLRSWIARARPDDHPADQVEILRIPSARRGRSDIDPGLEPTLAAGDDPLMAPLRVAWFPATRDGQRTARLSDILKLGDPRDPGFLRTRWVSRNSPERCRIVAGEPAPASDLRQRWRQAAGGDMGSTIGLADFVARQAALALERAERRLRGARYKVPRFVSDELLSRPAFRGELAGLARSLGKNDSSISKEAAGYLKEIAASHSPFVIDLIVQLWTFMYSRAYGPVLHHVPAQIENLRGQLQQHPVVFLPTHKSNLDHGVLQALLHQNGLPPNHTAGGINMNFFPLGPLIRRSGIFFIRRTFKDNPVYKAVLRHYIDYLIEKRFSLEWYIEGGRSRSGKLLPPRFGMLAYVVDAYRRGCSEDVHLVPVSICYDQISDVGDYANEARGGTKETEGFFWFLKILRRMSRKMGKIVIRFGEPISLAATLGPPNPEAEPNPDEQSLALQKLAFEVCVRINQATPITPISLVCLALLGRGDRALTSAEMVEALANLVGYVERRGLATTEPLDLSSEKGVATILEELTEGGLLVRYDAGPEAVYRIGDDQHLAAAYYRNSVIHYFVAGAICELALLRAAEDDVEDQRHEFWDMAMGLRDLLKFEFFFEEKDIFRDDLRRELSLHDPNWESALDEEPEALVELLQTIRPFSAHRILRPFLEAYRVVADALVQSDPDNPMDEPAFLNSSLALGGQYALQRHVKRQESISKVLFATALKLARNRGLLDPAPDLQQRREAFAEELSAAIRRVDAVEALMRARQAGLFD
ncbi:MAG: glycerol-3-phosphate 1-O-acyltransferase [Deltaproteobacteria bacterium]|nr:glycerol-3-phosphate 1-O-acyltransferase [Deltaproteobacteria bacterium]MBW2395767.1 glycerol-3-phosphate 1-O-acyltransferase [Deltaproteobacteria bacterium]